MDTRSLLIEVFEKFRHIVKGTVDGAYYFTGLFDAFWASTAIALSAAHKPLFIPYALLGILSLTVKVIQWWMGKWQ